MCRTGWQAAADLRMTVGRTTGGRVGPTGQVLGAWADLRGSTRRLLASDPREGTLLALALASGAIWFLGRIAGLWLSPEAAGLGEAALIGRAQAEFVAAVFFRTLMLYAVAALAGLAARAFGGTGGWKDTRAAVFWAALVAAPVLLAVNVLAALLEPVSEPAAAVIRSLGGLAFAWAFAVCIAEAHGFRSGLAVLGVIAAAGMFVVFPLYIFG